MEKSYLHYENDKRDAEYLRIEDLVEAYEDFSKIYANLSLVTISTCSFDDGVEENLKLTSENLKSNHDAIVERYNIFVTDCVTAINETKDLFEKYGRFYGADKYETLDKGLKFFLPPERFNTSKYNFLQSFVYNERKDFCFKTIVDEFYAHCTSCEQLIRDNPQETTLSRKLHEYFLDYISAYLFAHSKIWKHFAYNKTLGNPHDTSGARPTQGTYPGWNKNWDYDPGNRGNRVSSSTKSTLRSSAHGVIDFTILPNDKMHELLMPRLSGGSYDPPYDAIPILYYYFAIDSHKIKKTLSETSQKRADWWTSAQQTTKQEIKTIVEKISGFTAPAFTTSTGVSTDGNYLRFFAQNIHKSDNIKRFFDTDVSLIIEGAKVKNKRGSDCW